MRARVEHARAAQQARGFYNANIPHKALRDLCSLDDGGERTLEMAVRRMSLSARAHDRILKVARTIADLFRFRGTVGLDVFLEAAREALRELAPEVPVLAEESADVAHAERAHWRRFWLVDPLDGTKEFVSRNGEFTVNIALIERDAPVLGVVHVPVKDVTYAACRGGGAYKRSGASRVVIHTQAYDGRRPPRVVVAVVFASA